MSQIKISVPHYDHVALRAMAKALEEIAVARGAPAQSRQVGELNYKVNIDTTQATAALEQLVKQAEVDTTSQQQCESLLKGYEELPAVHDSEQAPPTTDSTGTPWDERIHSASKALNSDGTWRVRRKPKDMDEGEWNAQVESVKTELDRLCKDEGCDHYGTPHECVSVNTGIESLDIQQEIDNAPDVTPDGDDFHVDAGEVTEQEVASIPVPPLPVPPAPPVFATAQEVDEPTMTFPQVMAFLTERHGRITSAQVDDIIADMGLNSIMDLNTQPEHTGPFIARVKALLGE